MKRKGLTIIFFSVMVLAATPRAMHHFHQFVAAAQNHAQVELLNFLLSYCAPDSASQTAPQPSTELAESETVRGNQAVASSSQSNFAPNAQGRRKVQKSAVAIQTKELEFSLADIERALAEGREFAFEVGPEFNFSTASLKGLAKGENLKSLLNTNRLDRRKVALAWQREFNGVVRSNVRPALKNPPLIRVNMERDEQSVIEAAEAQAAPKAEDCSSKLSAGEF